MDATTKNKKQRIQQTQRAALETAKSQKRCRNCTSVGLWRTCSSPKTKMSSRVHYVRCKACGYPDKIVLDATPEQIETTGRKE